MPRRKTNDQSPSCKEQSESPIHQRAHHPNHISKWKNNSKSQMYFPTQYPSFNAMRVLCVGDAKEKASQDQPSHSFSAVVESKGIKNNEPEATQRNNPSIFHHPILCMPTEKASEIQLKKDHCTRKETSNVVKTNERRRKDPPNYKFLGGEAEEIRQQAQIFLWRPETDRVQVYSCEVVNVQRKRKQIISQRQKAKRPPVTHNTGLIFPTSLNANLFRKTNEISKIRWCNAEVKKSKGNRKIEAATVSARNSRSWMDASMHIIVCCSRCLVDTSRGNAR